MFVSVLWTMPRAGAKRRLGMSLATINECASYSRGHDKGSLAKNFYLRIMPFGVTTATIILFSKGRDKGGAA
jgi:hypothetical protein